jgi:hypothetical protein
VWATLPIIYGHFLSQVHYSTIKSNLGMTVIVLDHIFNKLLTDFLKSVKRAVSSSHLFVSFLVWHKTSCTQVLGVLKETGDSMTLTMLCGLLLLYGA